MDLTEKTKGSKKIFEGHIVNLKLDTVELPNGKEATRECIEHPGAVAIVAIDREGSICLVRQYRYPTGEALWEIPAGKLGAGEDPAECAKRELQEETGLIAAQWRKKYEYYTTPGFTNEKMHLYVASELTVGTSNPDDDEFLEIAMVPETEVWNMLTRGEIRDGKTIIGILDVFLTKRG
ncbi:MAG: NUDIX domain-containing protein [Chitinophagales bacterium]